MRYSARSIIDPNPHSHTTVDYHDSAQEIEKLKTLAEETDTVLYQISSVFPFQIIPDKIIIDKNKVTVVRKWLFNKHIFPMLYENITTVKVNRGLMFASIEFELLGFEENPGAITFLWPEKAGKAEHYILGMIKAKREQIDLSKLRPGQINKHIEKIGSSEEEAKHLF
jgi:hypothetical protein